LKILSGIIIGVLVVVVIVALILGYFGFIPGLSNIFGSNQPVKLGTTFTAQDYQSAIAKTGINMNDNLANLAVMKSDKVYGPPKPVNVDFTESDLTGSFFEDCDLQKAIFLNTNLEKVDFRSSINFSIDPEKNRIRKAKFSRIEIVGLLNKYDIEIE